MKCSTMNLVPLFALLFAVIGRGSANGSSQSISQLEKNEFKELMPEFKQRLLRWMDVKKRDCQLKAANNLDATYLDCGLCKASVESVKIFIGLRMDSTVVSMIRTFCTIFHIETASVCKGIVEAFKEEFLLIAKNVALSPAQICTISMGNPCNEKIDPRLNWTLPLPPKPAIEQEKQINAPINRPYPVGRQSKQERETFKFLQISDTHVDLDYLVGANAACNEPLCCRSRSNYLYSRSLDLDVQMKARTFGLKLFQDDELTAGVWGSYGSCDVPMHTFILALKQIAEKHSHEIDYVIWTGDVPSHDVWLQSKEKQIEMIRRSGEQFAKYLNDTPIYPALGNHEGYPVNSFPPKNILPNQPQVNMDWLYPSLSELWGQWLPKGTISSIKKGAYYSAKIRDGLRIISLNTNYCNDENWWLLINGTDPENELTWLINQLADAERANEKVHIIGHIPPGKNDCLQIWSENYYRIVSRFNQTIRGQFYGHTHSDEFQLFFDHDQLNQAKSTDQLTPLTPVSVAYLAPSITTFVGANPGYRIYEVDANTFELVDFHNYFLDLPEANAKTRDDPTYTPSFEYSYNPIDHYGMTDLSADSWLRLAERMYQNITLLNDYLYLQKNKAGSAEMIASICPDDECKRRVVCEMLRGKSHDDDVCALVMRRFKSDKNS